MLGRPRHRAIATLVTPSERSTVSIRLMVFQITKPGMLRIHIPIKRVAGESHPFSVPMVPITNPSKIAVRVQATRSTPLSIGIPNRYVPSMGSSHRGDVNPSTGCSPGL